jgi:hypothetical protein
VKYSVKGSVKKSSRINRQRRLQKQLQVLLLERHSRRCIICHHPEREAIEEEFVHWRSPSKLAHDYKLADYRTVYRHARAAGLLLQRRERLHSALDAFVESVDDVTFTGDTILRAMRAYSCIDSHGRWTEIPTQVQFSTSHDGYPPQPPSPYPKNDSTAASDIIDIDPDEEREEDEENECEEHECEEHVTASDVLDVVRKYSNQAPRSDATTCSVRPKIKSRSDATFCAVSPAQAVNVTEDEYADPENDDPDDDDSDADQESEEDAENELQELVTSLSTSSKSLSRSDAACPTSSKSMSHSDTTACAAPPAQPVSVVPLNSNQRGRNMTATTCADSPAQALPRDVVRGQNPNDRSPSDRTDCAVSPAQPPAGGPSFASDILDIAPKYSNQASRSDATACAAPSAQTVSAVPLNSNNRGRNVTATACADSPAQALPRDVVRGHNPNDRSLSDRTACAVSPRPSMGAPAQPAAPQKPKPDADGRIWHQRPGYPDQEMSEPDAEGRVMYKIHMTTAASQLPSRESDAQRAAELIYRSVIKKYGNP